MFDLEQILYLLAARGGAISRSSLERAIAEFARHEPSLNTNGRSGFEALRALDWLGHCETAGRKGRASVMLARASLARLPGLERSRAALVGARSASTLTELQELCAKSKAGVNVLVSDTSTNSGGFSIKRIVLEADSFDAIETVSNSAAIPMTFQPAAWELACASMSVTDFEKSIHWEAGYPVPREAEHFSPETLRFDENYS